MTSSLSALLAEVAALDPGRIRAVAAAFAEAEGSVVAGIPRAMARHVALEPDTPGVIDTLVAQLELSAAMTSWEVVYGLDPQTAYAARAAVLDMGLVLTTPGLAGRAGRGPGPPLAGRRRPGLRAGAGRGIYV